MTAPGFWDNQETAQEEVEDLKTLNQTLKPLERSSRRARTSRKGPDAGATIRE